MNVLLVSGDLMLVSAAEGIVRSHSATLTTVGAAAAVEECREIRPRIVAVDLRAPELTVERLFPALREACDEPVYILAFGPHVQVAALETAAAAGCDEVATRGQFEARLRAIVVGFGGG